MWAWRSNVSRGQEYDLQVDFMTYDCFLYVLVIHSIKSHSHYINSSWEKFKKSCAVKNLEKRIFGKIMLPLCKCWNLNITFNSDDLLCLIGYNLWRKWPMKNWAQRLISTEEQLGPTNNFMQIILELQPCQHQIV